MGVGWGGCLVYFVFVGKVKVVREVWEREYYSKLDLSEEQKEVVVVVSKLGSGSVVYLVDDKFGLVVVDDRDRGSEVY